MKNATILKVGAIAFSLVSLSACLPSALPRYVSDGGPSVEGAWRDRDPRPAIGPSPAPVRLPPQVSAAAGMRATGMPIEGIAPYRQRISGYIAGFLLISLECIAPEGWTTVPEHPKVAASNRGAPSPPDLTLDQQGTLVCRTRPALR